MRTKVRRIVLSVVTVLTAFALIGCQTQSQSDSAPESTGKSKTTPEKAAADLAVKEASAAKEAGEERTAVEAAKAIIKSGDPDMAAKQLYGLMIRYPDNGEVKLMTAQIESARGNLDTALEIAAAIDIRSASGIAAVSLRYQTLAQRGRHDEAADVILDALQTRGDQSQWRHHAWSLLNYVGRRQEAAQQALALCRLGLASEQELHSLIGRRNSFPTPAMAEQNKQGEKLPGERLFADGLGKARWFFSLGEHNRAYERLSAESHSGFRSAAANAFYGRVLAETQRWEEFGNWHDQVTNDVKQFSDYWSGLGTFFIDNGSDEAAARSLLEAISRDPTDRLCCQRLSKALAALGQTEDGEQFRHRGVDLSQTERLSEELLESPSDTEKRKQLAKQLLQLGRPFETLAWTASILPADAFSPRQQIKQQRIALLSDPAADSMATESSLLELDPNDFEFQPALSQLLTDNTTRKPPPVAPPREILATPRLVNRADELGLEFQWYKDVEIDLTTIPIHESLGGGIAVLDYDLDGAPDVYFGQGSGDPPTDQCTRSNQMFRNVGIKFTDQTTQTQADDYHYSSGIAAGDVNQDGFPDLFLGSLGHNRLLINNGDGTFRDATSTLGDFDDRFTSSVAIADINGDRLPELFESNYIEMEGGFALPKVGPDGKLISPTPLSHYPDSDRWLENKGNGDFQLHEISRSVANPGTSLGLVITDFESDGKNEVFVGIDVRPNHLLVQSGKNSFVNLADSNGLANGFEGAANGCMGIATGDFNRDGRFDMQIANYSLEPANLYLQNATGDFTDYSVRYGLASVTNPYVGFGTKAADFDRNGFLDFIVTNGHIFDLREEGEPYQMEPQVLMSDGRSLTLAKVEDSSGYWDGTYLGRSIAMLDYDRDGASDFLIGHLDQNVALLHDETDTEGDWLQFEVIGTVSERDAIGAKLVLTIDESQYTQWVTAGDGYFCSDEPIVAFAMERVDPSSSIQLRIHWPSGSVQDYDAIQPGRRYLMIENDAEANPR